MDNSSMLALGTASVVLGFAVLGVATRYLWVNEYYTPSKRNRRSRTLSNKKSQGRHRKI